jgi:hypothetical protein
MFWPVHYDPKDFCCIYKQWSMVYTSNILLLSWLKGTVRPDESDRKLYRIRGLYDRWAHKPAYVQTFLILIWIFEVLSRPEFHLIIYITASWSLWGDFYIEYHTCRYPKPMVIKHIFVLNGVHNLKLHFKVLYKIKILHF